MSHIPPRLIQNHHPGQTDSQGAPQLPRPHYHGTHKPQCLHEQHRCHVKSEIRRTHQQQTK